MKRNLFTQMLNEWRDNVWLILGLTVVTLAIWWLAVDFYNDIYGLQFKRGFDIEDVYSLSIERYPAESPLYNERSEDEEKYLGAQDIRMLISAIRKSPYVEAAALSLNGLPYCYGHMFATIKLDCDPPDTIGYAANVRLFSPDMVRVLKLTSRTGKSRAELENILRNGEVLISNLLVPNRKIRKPEELIGKKVINHSETIKVGDIIDKIRRSDYDVLTDGMVVKPIIESRDFYHTSNIDGGPKYEIGLRVKPEMGLKFRREFENDPTMQSYGNHYLMNLTKMSDRADSLQKKEDTNARRGVSLILFLILISSLGILGVFWSRTQQRISEIAIRKVCGAKSRDIFRRIISEGLILLIIASLLAAPIGWTLLIYFNIHSAYRIKLINSGYYSSEIFILELITFVIVAIGLTISLWWPAYRAMKIQPAIAIKDE